MNVINIDPKRFPSFAGSGALITGRSSGFGLATAELLSSLSCRVIIADIQPPPPTASPSLHFHRTDVTSYASLLSAFETSFTLFNSYPNIVFANAGINEKGSVFVGVTDEEIKSEPKHEVLEINLRAVANTVRIGWWGIKKNGKQGNIIMTSSVAGYLGVPGLGMYTPAEHGVVGMLRTLRPSGPKDKVAISLVAPAITVTPLIPPAGVGLKDLTQTLKAQGVPLNTAERIAESVVWMAAQKQGANGIGLCVQGGDCVDLEKSIALTRPIWMGERMSKLYYTGRGTNIHDQAVKLRVKL